MIIRWSGHGWLAIPLAFPGGVVAGMVADDLLGLVLWYVVSSVLAGALGFRMNSVASPDGRYWHNNHSFFDLPLQLTGGGYGVIAAAVGGIAYGRQVSAWLGWTIFIVGGAATVGLTLLWSWWLEKSATRTPPSEPTVTLVSGGRATKRRRAQKAGSGARVTATKPKKARGRPGPLVLTSEHVRVNIDAQRLAVSRRTPGGSWARNFDLPWAEIRHLRFSSDPHDPVVALHAGTVAGVRRYVMDSRHLDAGSWRRFADAVAANTGGRLTLDLTGRA